MTSHKAKTNWRSRAIGLSSPDAERCQQSYTVLAGGVRYRTVLPRPYALDCAFETAEILLTYQTVELEVSWDWFSTSASLLASTYININCQIQAREVMWLAINRLEKDLQKNPVVDKWVDQYLRQLYSELNNLIAPDCTDKGIGTQVPKAVEPLTLIH